MTPEEAAAKQARAIVERAQLVRKKFLTALTPDEAKRLAELDAHLDDLSLILHPEFYAACDRTMKRIKGDT